MFSPKRLVEDAIPSEFKLEPVFEVLSVDSRLGFNIRAEIIRTWFSGKLIIRSPKEQCWQLFRQLSYWL